MILKSESNPKNSLYFIGGMILMSLKEKKEMDYLFLYKEIKQNYHVSFQLYNYALDWLYLISAVSFDDKEGIIKCI